MSILISDANPVQFWRIDCDTWNQSDPEGIFHKKFCAPWNCDDTIKVEFSDVLGDDTNLTPTPFASLSELLSRSTSPTLIDWTTGATPSVSNGSAFTSEVGYIPFSFVAGLRYVITVTFTGAIGLDGAANIRIRTYDSSFNVLVNGPASLVNNAGGQTVVIDFAATEETAFIGMTVVSVLAATVTLDSIAAQKSIPDEYHLAVYGESDEILASVNFSSSIIPNTGTAIYSASFVPETYSICDQEIYLKIVKSTGTPDIEVAKSDGLDIKTAHTETVLINYSNHRNFAGLYYSSVSPDQEFFIRIPAVFNKMRFPQEGEDLQLSSNRVIALNSQMKVQKRLSTGKMPSYMHLKMVLILQHQTLYIDGQYWVKGSETYEQIESPRTDPFEKYFVWLTQKDYVVRNIL